MRLDLSRSPMGKGQGKPLNPFILSALSHPALRVGLPGLLPHQGELNRTLRAWVDGAGLS